MENNLASRIKGVGILIEWVGSIFCAIITLIDLFDQYSFDFRIFLKGFLYCFLCSAVAYLLYGMAHLVENTGTSKVYSESALQKKKIDYSVRVIKATDRGAFTDAISVMPKSVLQEILYRQRHLYTPEEVEMMKNQLKLRQGVLDDIFDKDYE